MSDMYDEIQRRFMQEAARELGELFGIRSVETPQFGTYLFHVVYQRHEICYDMYYQREPRTEFRHFVIYVN